MKMQNKNVQILKIIPEIALMAFQKSHLKGLLLLVKTVQLGDMHCLDSLGGPIIDGRHLGIYYGCRVKKRQLIFLKAGNMISICRI